MTVSNEDRDAAINWTAEAIHGEAYGHWALERATGAINALIAHGWGPRPTVSGRDLDRFLRSAASILGNNATMALRGYLRDCGIEVTQ